MTPPRTRLSHDQRLVLLALGALAPSAILALVLLWTGDHHPRTQWTLTVTLAVLAAGFLASLRARVIMPLQTVANLLSALREGDFSIRARGSRRADPLYDLHAEVNALAEMLRGQRLDSLEATALLRKVMAELDVAVFTFDERRRLQLVNHAGERLLGAPAERLLDRHAAELEMDQWLDSGGPRIEPIALPGATGRWEVRHTPFRQRGLPHHLVVLTDVSKPLRDEERAAWQRLIRVLGHELNNSLAPIKSIAGSLGSLVQREPRAVGLGSRSRARPRRHRDARRGAEPLHGRLRAAGAPAGAEPAVRCASGRWSNGWRGSTSGVRSPSTAGPT